MNSTLGHSHLDPSPPTNAFFMFRDFNLIEPVMTWKLKIMQDDVAVAESTQSTTCTKTSHQIPAWHIPLYLIVVRGCLTTTTGNNYVNPQIVTAILDLRSGYIGYSPRCGHLQYISPMKRNQNSKQVIKEVAVTTGIHPSNAPRLTE